MSAAGADNIFIHSTGVHILFFKMPTHLCRTAFSLIWCLADINTLEMFLRVLYGCCWRFVVVTSIEVMPNSCVSQCAEPAHLFLIGRMDAQLCHHQIVLVYSLSLFTSACFAPITSHVMSTKGHVTCQVACYITHNHLAAVV
jgi:hypothetical protein